MRFVLDGHVYTGPEPSGQAGLDLGAKAWALLGSMGYGDLVIDTPAAMRRVVAMQRALVSHPAARPLWGATFVGWTRDGQPLTLDTMGVLYTGAKLVEPWAAMVRVWVEAGFFELVEAGEDPEAVVAP